MAIKGVEHQWYRSYEYKDFERLEFDIYVVERKFRLLETDNFLVLPTNSYVQYSAYRGGRQPPSVTHQG